MVNRAISEMAFRDLIEFFDLPFSGEELTRFQSLARDTHQPAGLVLECLPARAEGVSCFREPWAAQTYFNSYNELLSSPQVEVPKQLLGLTAIPTSQTNHVVIYETVGFSLFRQHDK